MRTLALAAGALVLATMTAPASASGGAALVCSFHTGGTTGSATCAASGVDGTNPFFSPSATNVTFTYGNTSTCPIATAQGTFAGAITGSFTLTRFGTDAVVTGFISGSTLVGTATFSSPCWAPLEAAVMNWVFL